MDLIVQGFPSPLEIGSKQGTKPGSQEEIDIERMYWTDEKLTSWWGKRYLVVNPFTRIEVYLQQDP